MMKAKVLLVDDEEPIRRLLKTVLEIDGKLQVKTAASSAEAIKILQDDTFDVVVTDLRMDSHVAGYEVVKAASRLAPKPVTVILTAFPVPASEWKKSGADALFTKGGGSLNLAENIERLLGAAHPPTVEPCAYPSGTAKC